MSNLPSLPWYQHLLLWLVLVPIGWLTTLVYTEEKRNGRR